MEHTHCYTQHTCSFFSEGWVKLIRKHGHIRVLLRDGVMLYSVGADEGGGDWMSECSLCCIQ